MKEQVTKEGRHEGFVSFIFYFVLFIRFDVARVCENVGSYVRMYDQPEDFPHVLWTSICIYKSTASSFSQ